MTGTTRNTELAYQVLDHIDAHPEQWRQRWWLSKGACGTQACFAGWVCILSGDQPDITDGAEVGQDFEAVNTPLGTLEYVAPRATVLLGLEDEQADELFYSQNSREDLGRLVAEIFGPRPTDDCICKGADLPHAQGLRGCVDGPLDRPLDDVPPNAGSES